MAQVIPAVIQGAELVGGTAGKSLQGAGDSGKDFEEVLSKVKELISRDVRDAGSGKFDASAVDEPGEDERNAVDYLMEVMAALAILYPGKFAGAGSDPSASVSSPKFAFEFAEGDPVFEKFVSQVVAVLEKFVEAVETRGGPRQVDFSQLAAELSKLLDGMKFSEGEAAKAGDSAGSFDSKVKRFESNGVEMEIPKPAGKANESQSVKKTNPFDFKDPGSKHEDVPKEYEFLRVKEVEVKGADSGGGTSSGREKSESGGGEFQTLGSAVGRSDVTRGATVKEQVSYVKVARAEAMRHEAMNAGRSAVPKTLALELEPPELGRVLLDLTVRDGVLKANVRVENQGVKDLFAAALPHIRRALQEMGIKPGDFHLSTREDGNHYGRGDGWSWSGGKSKGNNPFQEFGENL